jgi:hypothetical protein
MWILSPKLPSVVAFLRLMRRSVLRLELEKKVPPPARRRRKLRAAERCERFIL